MENVSKFTLNPLATCFVPSSMKFQNTTCSFSFPSEKTLKEPVTTKNGNSSTVSNEKDAVSEYLPVIKVEPDLVKKEALGDFCVTVEVKETLSDTVEEAVTEHKPLTTEQEFSTVNEMPECTLAVAESDDKRSSGKNSKERINLKDTCLTELDISLPNQTLVSKVAKLVKGGTRTLLMLLPSAIRSLLVLEFFYRMGLKTISMNLTMTSQLCPVLKPKLKAVTYPGNAKKSETKIKIKGGECHCPTQFGCIIPHRCLGNSLKLSETCKDYVHTSYANENSRHSQSMQSKSYRSCEFNDEKTTLEQCSLELKAIIKDVCSLLSFDQSTEDPNHTSEVRNRPVWENKTEKIIGDKCSVPDIIDDGVHPLLENPPEMNDEDIDMSSIQAFLGEAFSQPKTRSSEEILPKQSVCNPPCSIWCDKVPSPAREAYKRFIKEMNSESAVRHKVTNLNKKVFQKPLYKRSFSAADTPESDKIPLLSPFSFETREQLIQKGPVLFKHSSTSALKDISNISRSDSPVVFEQYNLSKNCPDKWSVYDEADSMWQPLPECPLLPDTARKQSKKARDMRRKKSVC